MAASIEARIVEYAAAPTPPLPLPSPPTHTSPTYAEAPLGYRVAAIQWRATSPSTHHPLEIQSPPLLLPSTTHKDDLPEVDMPLQKRAHFTALTGRFEVRESSSAVAARQTGHTLAHRVEYGFVDTVDDSIRALKSRAMTAIGEGSSSCPTGWVAGLVVSGEALRERQLIRALLERPSLSYGKGISSFHVAIIDGKKSEKIEKKEVVDRGRIDICEDAQDDRALLRTQVSLLTRERRYFHSMASSYEREAVITRQAWAHSKSRNQVMEAQIRALQRDVDVLQRKGIRDEDKLTSYI
ncbi:hypothetical protein Tco_0039346 [Tanacetum coccineum]